MKKRIISVLFFWSRSLLFVELVSRFKMQLAILHFFSAPSPAQTRGEFKTNNDFHFWGFVALLVLAGMLFLYLITKN